MHVGLAEQHAGVVHQVPRAEVVAAVDDQIVGPEQIERVVAVQPDAMLVDRHVGVQLADGLARRLRLRHADALGIVEHLALQVRLVDHVVVHDAQPAHARRGQVEPRRRAQPAGADEQYLRLEQLRLARLADFGDQQMPAVAVPLRVGQAERHLHRKPSVLPRAIPAAQATHLPVTHLLQRPAREEAPGAAGAVEDHVGVPIREALFDAQLQVAARHQLGAGQDALIRLLLLADVDERRPLGLQLLGQLSGGHFRHLRPGNLEQLGLGLGFCHGTP